MPPTEAPAIRLVGCDDLLAEPQDPNDLLSIAVRLSSALIAMQTALRALQGRVDELVTLAETQRENR